MIDDIVGVAWKVAVALEQVGVPYYVGGSVASSLQATARSTNDIDFVVELEARQVSTLARLLGDEFSVDEESLVEAANLGSSWNIFHLPSGLKIDFLIRKNTAYDREAFTRRRRFQIDDDVNPFIKSVEDSILKKLQWFIDGGRVSSTQWRDVVELLRVNRASVDRGYLLRWAPLLEVADDLKRAEAEAAAPKP